MCPPTRRQVRNAEGAGAIAAIVYDDVYEPLIIMSKPPDHPDPGIPSVSGSSLGARDREKERGQGVVQYRLVEAACPSEFCSSP